MASVVSRANLYQRAAETALRRGLRDVAADFEETNARADALSGNCDTVRRLGRPALALAMCGDAGAGGEACRGDVQAFSEWPIWNAVQLPEIRAAIELQRGQPAKAVELLASASPYERAYPEAVYLRGLAYLRLRKGVGGRSRVPEDPGSQGGELGQYVALSELGTVLFDFLIGPGPRFRARGQHGGSAESLRRLLRACGRTPTRISGSSLTPSETTPHCAKVHADKSLPFVGILEFSCSDSPSHDPLKI